jgi:hypothetical protein
VNFVQFLTAAKMGHPGAMERVANSYEYSTGIRSGKIVRVLLEIGRAGTRRRHVQSG